MALMDVTPPRVINLRLDSGVELPGETRLQLAATVWLPEHPQQAPAVLVCLPGGGMTRRYYDLRPPDDANDPAYSFAAQMCARGFVVAAIDTLGVGDSDRPEDGWQLTPAVLTRVNVHAAEQIVSRLREGRLAEDVPALPGLASIGVGHSMGAMLTVWVQATAKAHAAVALLGFSTRGLPEYLPEPFRKQLDALPDDPAVVEAKRIEWARATFRQAYPPARSGGRGDNTALFGSSAAERRGVEALKSATGPLLAIPALVSMLPGNVASEAASLDVPVFLGVGERDMVGPPEDVPAAFPFAPSVELVVLPETGHSHFLFPSRFVLFDQLANWARGLASG